MIGIVQSRADKVVHSSIKNYELLACAFLYISRTRYESTALGHYAPAKLKMHLLTRIQFKIIGICGKIEVKIGDRILVGRIVAYAQAAADIDVRKNKASRLMKQFLQFVYPSAQRNEVVHYKNL